jgi:hypothetical protein
MGRYISRSENRKKCDGRKRGANTDRPETAARKIPVKRHTPHPTNSDDYIRILVI